mgnify:CR=1 FL=1
MYKRQDLKQYKRTMAIANPRHAPYGKAATETLELMQVITDRIVYGTNIAQAFNFVRTGNAPAGLVALSQIKYLKVPAVEFWVVPTKFYAPIKQQLVVLEDASVKAELFVAYTIDHNTTRLIEKSGYLAADKDNQTGISNSAVTTSGAGAHQ